MIDRGDFWRIREDLTESAGAGRTWHAGLAAGQMGTPSTTNPYPKHTVDNRAWEAGWVLGMAFHLAEHDIANRTNEAVIRASAYASTNFPDIHPESERLLVALAHLHADDLRKELGEEREIRFVLDRYFEIYSAGGLPAVLDAMDYCRATGLPPDDWMQDALLELLKYRLTPGDRHSREGKHSSPLQRYLDDDKHFLRYLAVISIKKEHERDVHQMEWNNGLNYSAALEDVGRAPTWEERYSLASEILRGTHAFASDVTIKKSYQMVKGDIQEHGAKSRYVYGHDWGSFSAWAAAAVGIRPLSE